MAQVELDHVLIATEDLAHTASTWAEEHGLVSVEGGRHPGWGTANRIVPLGTSYLELVAVVDERETAQSTFGRWVSDQASRAGRPIGWSVRPANLDETAGRLGLTPQVGSRVKPDRGFVRWRTAGVDEARKEPSLPFFIEWAAGSTFPGSLPVGVDPMASISGLDIEADPERLSSWLGPHALPLRVLRGNGGIRRVLLTTPAGEIVLGA
jgi:hypothetical protein